MKDERQPIDEYTLSAFLADTLSEERRRKVVAFLAENADARALLCMAQEALEAASAPSDVPTAPPVDGPEPIRPAAKPASTSASRRRQPWKPVVSAMLVAVILMLGGYLALRSDSATDTLRGETENTTLAVEVSTPALQFKWTPITDAYYYRIVIWDLEKALVVAQHETKETRLGRNDAFILSLYPQLELQHRYAVRVDAIDVQNRLIQHSASTTFRLEE